MLREDFIHISVGDFIRANLWVLLGGEPPGGSSDTLRRIYIKDPIVARDQSPDPRRHSKGSEKIDIIAKKGRMLLLIEAKPAYSLSDQEKLLRIKYQRQADLYGALTDRCGLVPSDIDEILLALAFSAPSTRIPHPEFLHFLISSDGTVVVKRGVSVNKFTK